MSELTNLDDARKTLRRLAISALQATQALHDGLNTPEREPTPEQSAKLNDVLGDMTKIREGFLLALRTRDTVLASELRDLLRYMNDWTWLGELGLRWQTDEPLEKLGGQTVLYQHAVIALGMLPRLPQNAVTFPRGRYADIPVPTTPGETLSRLEELENTVWKASHAPAQKLPRDAVRRTYGFFEATTWLMATHLKDVVGW
jgi:hypothetical protein